MNKSLLSNNVVIIVESDALLTKRDLSSIEIEFYSNFFKANLEARFAFSST